MGGGCIAEKYESVLRLNWSVGSAIQLTISLHIEEIYVFLVQNNKLC
jgi:hypothetical protein